MNEAYRSTIELLLDALPATFRAPNFALKGGTALNLFVLDMPRLSVDVDVAYVRLDATRDEALADITASLAQVAEHLTAQGLRVTVLPRGDGVESRIDVARAGSSVRIEVNTVIRGTVLPVETRRLGAAAQRHYRREVEIPMLAPAELYGGKLVAALDRQHPRDLFDVAQLFSSGGIDDAIRQCFVIYLASHNRPPDELLRPKPKDIRAAYENEFRGMTAEDVSLETLLAARVRLFDELPRSLTAAQRQFLRTLVRGEPDWAMAGIAHAERLPSLQWKLRNVQTLRDSQAGKFAAAVDRLEEVLMR